MTKKEIKTILYNIFGVNFVHKYRNEFIAQNPSISAYYYESYISIYFESMNYNFIKQKIINSKEIYEYYIYNIDGVICLYDSLKNIDI